jgi:hypothetical protein
MYNTYYLKFASQEEWDTKAEEAGYRNQNPMTEEVSYSVNPGAIDVIGIILNDDAVFDDEGDVVTPSTAKEGWHVNIRVTQRHEYDIENDQYIDQSLPEVLNNYIIHPQTPNRVFA